MDTVTKINCYIDTTEIFKNKNILFGNDIDGNKGKHKKISAHADIFLLEENNSNKTPKVIGKWYADWISFGDDESGTSGRQLIYIPNYGRIELPMMYNTDFITLIGHKFEMITKGNQTGTYFNNHLFGKDIHVNGEITGNIIIFKIST